MTAASAFDFGKLIPGFDFMQKLAASAPGTAGAMPGLGGWVAPTVNADELDKRINELKTVLFWLEQNSTGVKATIQALEVQKMTLAALAGMNLSVSEIAKAFTMPTPPGAASATAAPAPTPTAAATRDASAWPYQQATPPAPEPTPAATPAPTAAPEPAAAPQPAPPRRARKSSRAGSTPAAGVADPVQWWGAVTQQFQQIAANAMADAARHAAPPASADDAAANAPKSVAKKQASTTPRAKKTAPKTTRARAPRAARGSAR